MKTIYNNGTKEHGVFVGGDRHVLIAADGSKELENDIADQAIEQAQKDGVPFSLTPSTPQAGTPVPPSLTPAHKALIERLDKLGAHGLLIPLSVLGEDDLMALKKPTLLKMAEHAGCPPLLDEGTPKQAIVDEILEAATKPNVPQPTTETTPAAQQRALGHPTPFIPTDGTPRDRALPTATPHTTAVRPAGSTSGTSTGPGPVQAGSTPAPATNLDKSSPTSPVVKSA